MPMTILACTTRQPLVLVLDKKTNPDRF